MANRVNQPDGTGVVPASPAPHKSYPEWEVTYDVNWAAQASRDLTDGGGVETIDGVSWNPEQTGNATSMDIINGTGLKIVPSSGSFWTGTKDAPRVHAFVADGTGPAPDHGQLVNDAKPYDTIAFQWLLTVNTDISSSGDMVGMATGNNTAANYLTLCRAHDGTALRTAFRGEGEGTSDSYYVTTATAKTFYEVVVFPGGGMAATSTTDTTLAAPLTRQGDFISAGQMNGVAVFPTTEFDIFGDGTNWRLWLYAGGGGSYTFTRFRVLKTVRSS
jgi:hypothetical protein